MAVVLAGALAGMLSGCSAAPPAASVNGEVITQQQLDQWLQDWASSPAYISAQDKIFLSQAEQGEENGGQNVQLFTVQAPVGTGPGEYGLVWSVMELSNLITALAVRQHLDRLHENPTRTQVAAAWAAEYASDPTLWRQLSSFTRASAAQQDADHALVDNSLTTASQDSLFYKDNRSYFWSQVCLYQFGVAVQGANGAVNMGASKQMAEQDVNALSGHGANAGQLPSSGSRYCDSPEQFIEQPLSFQKQVGALAPGQATVLPETSSYEVVQVLSRAVIPYSKQIADDIEITATHGGSQTPPNGDAKVTDILLKADVKVNPEYGNWVTTLPQPCAPQIVAPGQADSCSG